MPRIVTDRFLAATILAGPGRRRPAAWFRGGWGLVTAIGQLPVLWGASG